MWRGTDFLHCGTDLKWWVAKAMMMMRRGTETLRDSPPVASVASAIRRHTASEIVPWLLSSLFHDRQSERDAGSVGFYKNQTHLPSAAAKLCCRA